MCCGILVFEWMYITTHGAHMYSQHRRSHDQSNGVTNDKSYDKSHGVTDDFTNGCSYE